MTPLEHSLKASELLTTAETLLLPTLGRGDPGGYRTVTNLIALARAHAYMARTGLWTEPPGVQDS